MARRCAWCNRIIKEDMKVVPTYVIEELIEKGELPPDYEKKQPLPMCIECLQSFGVD